MNEKSKGRRIRSAVVIAKLIGTEGFTDFVGNAVESYWRRRSGLSNGQKRQIEALDREVARVMASLSIPDRLAVGRFIGLHKKMSFDTGLKIGLQVFAQKVDGLIDSRPAWEKHEKESKKEALKQDHELPPEAEATQDKNASV